MLRESDDLFQAFEIHVRKPSFIVGFNGGYTRKIFAQMGLPNEEFDRIVRAHSDVSGRMNLGAWTGPKEDVSAEPLTGCETELFSDELQARVSLVAALMRRMSERAGKKRWGFKILGDIVYADKYAQTLPNAVFILLVRDPRDHALSVMKLNDQRTARGQQLFYSDYRSVARGWAHTIGEGRRVLEQCGLRHVVLRYEDLTAEPERQLTILGDVLRLDLSRSLDFHKQDYIGTHTERFKHHDKLKEPVNAASVGKWRTQMTEVDRAVFAEEAGTLMDLYGYER